MNRRIIFSHYWWIGILAGGSACLLASIHGGDDRAGLIGASVAGALGFCYFVQQQKLAETKLFYQLFTNFNLRYDEMNDQLSELVTQSKEASAEQRNLIADYFNLCAEEYIFYKDGYIPRDVWRAWCRGMSWYLRRHPFKEVWNEEIKSDSFYGLSIEIIQAGAQ